MPELTTDIQGMIGWVAGGLFLTLFTFTVPIFLIKLVAIVKKSLEA